MPQATSEAHINTALFHRAGAGSAAVNTDRYIAELGSLRGILEAALAEQQALEKRMAQVSARGGACMHATPLASAVGVFALAP